MVTAMFLAHLVGDYVLQWDSLAIWKSREVKGALAHGALVALITLAFAWLADPRWWPWALFIGLTHMAVDAAWLLNKRLPPDRQLQPLPRFVIDQIIHFSIIGLALTLSGYAVAPALLAELQRSQALTYLLGYVTLSMPAWVAVEFAVYGLVRAPAPDFSPSANKFLGMAERGLAATFVLLGQFPLVALVAVPRLVFDGPRLWGSARATQYLAEVLISLAAAVAIGLALRALVG